jgi:hypothetical protein
MSAWVSALKYMRVLRQTSRSRREMGGVAQQVVLAEDHRPPNPVHERAAVLGLLEVLLAEVVGDRLDFLLAVDAVAGLLQGGVVQVRGVDLDGVGEDVVRHGLGHEEGGRVRLLAGRAARYPYPDGVVRRNAFGDGGDDDLVDGLPGVLVAEEGRDVDEEGVEEFAILAGPALEDVLVLAERIEVEFRQAPLEPPPQRVPLVDGEVEAARVADELQEGVELGRLVGGLVFRGAGRRLGVVGVGGRLGSLGVVGVAVVALRAHSLSPSMTSFTRAGAMSSSGRTKSTHPVRMAACGMPKNSEEGSGPAR